jgi:uncharacterized protein
VFREDGDSYGRAQLVVYDGAVSTDGCGGATSAVGPFYCPADQRVYLDLTFYEDMRRQLGASGDFAWAYVIAHEVGHHVQNLAGTDDTVARFERDDPGRANELSVRLELQADCYAGVWASTVFAEGDLEAGDLEEAFTASEAVGDDRLQEQAGRAGGSRQLHPRELRATADLVRERIRGRRSGGLRHVHTRRGLEACAVIRVRG